MPDTTILKTSDGWIDRDSPTVFYTVRREARNARRGGYPRTIHSNHGTVTVNAPGVTATAFAPAATPSQWWHDKLTKRLRSQGATGTEIAIVIGRFGYNATASYGHIRAAGATHDEAFDVVGMGDPDISKAYSRLRSQHWDHTNALVFAAHR